MYISSAVLYVTPMGSSPRRAGTSCRDWSHHLSQISPAHNNRGRAKRYLIINMRLDGLSSMNMQAQFSRGNHLWVGAVSMHEPGHRNMCPSYNIHVTCNCINLLVQKLSVDSWSRDPCRPVWPSPFSTLQPHKSFALARLKLWSSCNNASNKRIWIIMHLFLSFCPSLYLDLSDRL